MVKFNLRGIATAAIAPDDIKRFTAAGYASDSQLPEHHLQPLVELQRSIPIGVIDLERFVEIRIRAQDKIP
jgi:hypothetical protein